MDAFVSLSTLMLFCWLIYIHIYVCLEPYPREYLFTEYCLESSYALFHLLFFNDFFPKMCELIRRSKKQGAKARFYFFTLQWSISGLVQTNKMKIIKNALNLLYCSQYPCVQQYFFLLLIFLVDLSSLQQVAVAVIGSVK